MKIELIELPEFEAGTAIVWVYAKGTIAKQDFADAYYSKYTDELKLSDVKQTIARWIPAGAGMSGVTVLYFEQAPGRGSFPITYVCLL